MPPKKTPKPKTQEPWTPLYEGLPDGMSLIDMAVYGEVVRRSKWAGGKFTASAPTLAKMFHVNERTIDRSLASLEEWKVIVCTFRGKATREASHYVPNKRALWNVPTRDFLTLARKASKQKSTRDSVSKTRDSKSRTRDSVSTTRDSKSHKESIGENRRVSKESKGITKKKKNSTPTLPLPELKSPDVNNHVKSGYTKRHYPTYNPFGK